MNPWIAYGLGVLTLPGIFLILLLAFRLVFGKSGSNIAPGW